MADQQQIRERIAPLIRDKGIRATERQLGIPHGSISRWLSGERQISVALLERLCRAAKLRIEIRPEEDGPRR